MVGKTMALAILIFTFLNTRR